jgi:protein O-GlcNAc transferase
MWTPHPAKDSKEDDEFERKRTRKQDALRFCSYVLGRVMDNNARLIISIPRNQLTRLQRVWHTSASLRHSASNDVLHDYIRAVEVAIRPPVPYGDEDSYTFRDLLIATHVAGLLASSRGHMIPANINNAIHIASEDTRDDALADRPSHLLRHVRGAPSIGEEILAEDGVLVPLVLLSPDEALSVASLVFAAFDGALPALYAPAGSGPVPLGTRPEQDMSNLNYSTAATILHIAKRVHDVPAGTTMPFPGFPRGLTAGPSVLLLLYSLALSLSPSASVFNNLGLILAEIAPVVTIEGGGRYHMSDQLTLAQVRWCAQSSPWADDPIFSGRSTSSAA